MVKVIYRFSKGGSDGDASMKDVLGGKGANLAEMALLGIPVPPGFTIPTEQCRAYRKAGYGQVGKVWPDVVKGMAWLADQLGFQPLVSVRSGAPMSCPGMMDTILNVGLTQGNLGEWSARIGARAALDSYRRLIQMLGSTAYGVPHAAFEKELAAVKEEQGCDEDRDLTAESLEGLITRYKKVFQAVTQQPFPDNAQEQLRAAIEAVWKSWDNERAVTYRKLQDISGDVGTAVTVQAMVFGNFNDESGSGVLFSRNPSTGENKVVGEFLANAQGEDVVAGIRTPLPLERMAELWPDVTSDLLAVVERLEAHYKDMQDVEFTVQDKVLYMLQCRIGKRSALAAVRIAVDLAEEGLIDRKEAVRRVKPYEYKIATQPTVDPAFAAPADITGIPAGVGVAVGKAVTSSADAVKCSEPCVLVTHETNPNDIEGMAAAKGILTITGGSTSHAAVVARALNKVCIVGAASDPNAKILDPGAMEGRRITLDGATGRVWLDIEVPVIDGAEDPRTAKLRDWVLAQWDEPVRTDWPVAGECVVALSDWWFDSDRLEKLVATVLARGPAGLVLDLTPPSQRLGPEDADLVDVAFLAAPLELAWAATVMAKLREAGALAGVTFVLPEGQALGPAAVAAGAQTMTEATTVAEMLAGNVVRLGPALKAGLGEETVAKLLALAAKAGEPVRLARDGVHPEYAMFKTLGAA